MKTLENIPPPEEMRPQAAVSYYSICSSLLDRGELTQEKIPDIIGLSKLEGKRAGLIDELGLWPEDQRKQLDIIDSYIDLTDPSKFDARFDEFQGKFERKKDAYQAVEAQFKSVFGHSKYSGYDSYRHVRNQRLRVRLQV
jgi:hypothetical protein